MLPEYFEFLNPVKMLCGSGALENIPYELDRLGVKKPLALVSRTLLEEGIIERIGGKLEAVIQSDIPKDSSFSLVDSVAKRAREEGCDGVLAIGGGSVLDTAKAVRALLSQGERTLRAMLGSEWLTRGQPVPFVMVPTTSGTGSECTAVAVVQDDRSRLKQEIVSDQFLIQHPKKFIQNQHIAFAGTEYFFCKIIPVLNIAEFFLFAFFREIFIILILFFKSEYFKCRLQLF